MYKKITPAAAALLAAGMLLGGTADAAPKNPNAGQSEKVKEKEKEKEKENKGQLQQFKSIDKQLDKIEEKILAYKAKMAELEESEETNEPDGAVEEPADGADEESSDETVKEPTDGAVEEPADDTDEEPSDETVKEPADETVEEPAGDTVEEPVDGTEGEEPAVTEPVSTLYVAEEPQIIEEPAAEEIIEDEEVTDEEIQQEVEEITEQLDDRPGYAGKFNALQNQLSAVSNRLDGLEAKGADTAERRERVAVLQEDVKAVLASIGAIQEKVKETVKADKKAEEKKAVQTKEAAKEWKIKFSKGLDEATLSELDIVVLDAEQNLVETTLNYDVKTSAVTVVPGQPYQAGQTYTLYIGKGISGADGVDLKNSVKMNFTIAAQ